MVRTKNRRFTYCQGRPRSRPQCVNCLKRAGFFSKLSTEEKTAMVSIDCPLELDLTLRKGVDC